MEGERPSHSENRQDLWRHALQSARQVKQIECCSNRKGSPDLEEGRRFPDPPEGTEHETPERLALAPRIRRKPIQGQNASRPETSLRTRRGDTHEWRHPRRADLARDLDAVPGCL